MGDDLALLSPDWCHLLKGKVIPFCEQFTNITSRSVRVYGSFLNQKLMNCFSIAKNNDVG